MRMSQCWPEQVGIIDFTNASVVSAIQTIFDEISDVFPSPFVHCGGAERRLICRANCILLVETEYLPRQARDDKHTGNVGNIGMFLPVPARFCPFLSAGDEVSFPILDKMPEIQVRKTCLLFCATFTFKTLVWNHLYI
jgi:hypothetical protein